MKNCNQLCPWNTLYGCKKPESEPCILSNMRCEKFEKKPQTNADHIRSMTDEELAKQIIVLQQNAICYVSEQLGYTPPSPEIVCDADLKSTLDWLKQPYKEETND